MTGLISVILPAYENPTSVRCCLAALEEQTLFYRWMETKTDPEAIFPRSAPPYEIVVVDDSATGEVEQALSWWGFEQPWRRYLRVSPPRVGRFTASRARNVGVANARGHLCVFVDQDVMLAPDCLERYQEAYQRHGDNVVYVGLYHWLRRIAFDDKDVRSRFDDVVAAGLGAHNLLSPQPMDEPGLQGRDHREQDFGDIDKLVDDAALGAHSGNIGYPRKLFLELGGFDENIRGHGGEDADLGLTAKEHGAKFLLWNAIWGVHRWHPRNQRQNQQDVQQNIDYIDRKHGIGKYADARKWMDARDWHDTRHYHKRVGGVLMKAPHDETVWVCREGHRLGIPSPRALSSLGFAPEEVLTATNESLARYEVMGNVVA